MSQNINRRAAQPRSAQPVRRAQALSPAKSARPLIQTGISLFERYQAPVRERLGELSTLAEQISETRNAYREYKNLAPIPERTTRLAQANRVRREISSVVDTFNDARRLPGQSLTASRDIRQALRSGRSEDVGEALSSSREAVDTAKNLVEGAPQARTAVRNASRTLGRVAPRTTAAIAASANRVVASRGARVATRLATRAAAAPAARIATRAAARFVPGANVALAALDTAEAVRVLRDPNAGTGRRITSVLTAAGSIAAATNIPVISQAGAAFSTASSVIGSFFE